jgi:hypothetical protein
MKITKLHTLNRFVDNTISTFNESTEKVIMAGLLYKSILRYNDFLRLDVLEHMVYNEYKAIDEAEKKVISANVKKSKHPHSYDLSDRYNIGFTESGTYIHDNQTNQEQKVITLSDIAIATRGELPIQNLDI